MRYIAQVSEELPLDLCETWINCKCTNMH